MEIPIEDLRKVIMALKAFKGKYEKRLNFNKLCVYLETNGKKKDALLEILFEFQDLFKGILREHILTKEIEEDGNIFISTKLVDPESGKAPICISHQQLKTLNDIIHVFKNFRQGKGFNISKKSSELINNLRSLYYSFPFLFRQNGHNLIYPTEIAIELGSKVNEYNKLNVEYTNIEIENYAFLIGGSNDRN
jgi:hypothetical protein